MPPRSPEVGVFEARVLQRMDLLRRHQLLHPELVTEGMNRLAQALITLTDPIGKVTYDAQLGTELRPLGSVAPIQSPLLEGEASPLVVADPVFEDELLDAEVLHSHPLELTQEILLPDELQPAYGVLSPPPLPLREPERAKPVAKVIDAIPVVRPWPTPPSSRRWIYARLALLRRALRAWNRLQPVFLDPQDPLDRPDRVLLMLEGATAIRPYLHYLIGVMGGTHEPGGLVASVLKQPLLMDTMRRLLPEQRQALARDWRLGQLELEREYTRLRGLSVEERTRAEGIQRPPNFVQWLRSAPELVLLGFAVFVLLISFSRWLFVRGSSVGTSS